MEERQKTSLIRSGILIFVMIVMTVLIYTQLYSPMIQDILSARESLKQGELELGKLEGFSQDIKQLTEEEIITWKIAQAEIYKKCPPAEILPENITFDGSVDLFYGAGESIMGQIPQLFTELLQVALESKQNHLSLKTTHQRKALTLSAPGEGIQALQFDKSTVQFTVQMGFQELAEFLAQLQNLPRFIKISKLTVKPVKKSLTSIITLETFHCPQGVLVNVPEQ